MESERLQQGSGWTVDELKAHVLAIFEERRRAVEVASEEREKAARALAETLAEQIRQGDQALRDHIEQQVQQIRAALVAAEQLEVERVRSLSERLEMLNVSGHSQIESRIAAVEASAEQHVEQLRREREIVTGAQMEAIAKAEAATEKRFESVNEFRAQLNDVISQFVPREVADAQFAEVRKAVDSITARFNTMEGSDQGERRVRSSLSSSATVWIGALGLLVAVLSIAVVVILANA